MHMCTLTVSLIRSTDTPALSFSAPLWLEGWKMAGVQAPGSGVFPCALGVSQSLGLATARCCSQAEGRASS